MTLKSLRNPPIDITLSPPGYTSILDLKEQVSTKESIPVDKIRILFHKKPVGDSKSLQDVAGDEEQLDFSVMVIGGVASIIRAVEAEEVVPATVQGPSGAELLAGTAFWEDLNGYLIQRLKSEEEGKKVFAIFKAAWEQSDHV